MPTLSNATEKHLSSGSEPACSGRAAFNRRIFRLAALLLLAISGLFAPPSQGADTTRHPLAVTVVEAFVEVHTGPGRGYPVFHIAEQGETLYINKARNRWYRVTLDNGQTGWAKASQLARTLEPAGVPPDLPSLEHSDYLRSRWRIGIATGEFEGAEANSLIGGVRFTRWTSAELEIGHIFGISVDSNYYGANLLLEPFPQWQLTPFVTLSAGRMDLAPEQRLTQQNVDISSGRFTGIGGGANFYVGRNFVIRGEYRHYSVTADNDDNQGIREWKIGFSSFF